MTVSFSVLSGSVWLCGQLFEECAEHPHCLHPIHVHLCRHRSSAFQGKILLLYRWVQGPGEGLQVSLNSPPPHFFILHTIFSLLNIGVVKTRPSTCLTLYLCPHVFQGTVLRLWQRGCGCHAQRMEEIWVPLWQCAVGFSDSLYRLNWGGLANASEVYIMQHFSFLCR